MKTLRIQVPSPSLRSILINELNGRRVQGVIAALEFSVEQFPIAIFKLNDE